MTIFRDQRVTYQAECDGCGARGPERDAPASAIEAVTAEAATRSTGMSLLGRWVRTPSGNPHNPALKCPACAAGAKTAGSR